MSQQLKIFSYYLLPQHILSRIAGILANCKIVWFKNFLINIFINHYKINVDEAQNSDFNSYPDFNSFFTRELKPEARPIANGINSIISPADGMITQFGKIDGQELIQAKKFNFNIAELLGEKTLAENFVHGNYLTIYLSPKDYHRVHMPLTGTLQQMIYVPGKLFPVNNLSAENVPNLFARNERVVALFDTAIGPMAIVMVGALMVASVETVWAGTVTANKINEITIRDYQNNAEQINLVIGAELGRFKFGSTVIILLPTNKIKWSENLNTAVAIKMGQKIGEIL